jgi:hypothetical protein
MDAIESYIQKIHSALAGTGTLRISSFVNDHVRAQPILHPRARSKHTDMSALLYSILRLPMEIFSSRALILGQSDRIFQKAGVEVTAAGWVDAHAIARRRKTRYNARTKTTAMFVTSISDVEDILTIATAFYIEVMKLHMRVRDGKTLEECLPAEDFAKLQEVTGTAWPNFVQMVERPNDYEVTLLAGTHVEYSKAIQEWWIHIASSRKKYHVNVYKQPMYFVSSNSHSLINVLSGFPMKEKVLLYRENAERLAKEQEQFIEERVAEENICSYLSRFSEKRNVRYRTAKEAYEKKYGLLRLEPYHNIDIEAQIFSVRDMMRNPFLDKRLRLTSRMKTSLAKSDAVILNIAYPLGMTAYSVLKEVSENASEVRGVYIMGKTASLNASVGDITIPNYVRDMHTHNQIFVHNNFDVSDFSPFMKKNSILSQQKAVSVRGTFLQSEKSLTKDFYDGYSIIEMEAGPYLNRIYEMTEPTRYPTETTYMVKPDFRLGLAYYVSDTPHKQGLNLGAKRLTWEGLNATYAISLGILNDIFKAEAKR